MGTSFRNPKCRVTACLSLRFFFYYQFFLILGFSGVISLLRDLRLVGSVLSLRLFISSHILEVNTIAPLLFFSCDGLEMQLTVDGGDRGVNKEGKGERLLIGREEDAVVSGKLILFIFFLYSLIFVFLNPVFPSFVGHYLASDEESLARHYSPRVVSKELRWVGKT